jgi:glycosyltransferase involved in cell wall biosynthesis
MRCSLVITTHDRPDALARVLRSLSTQTRWPDEVIIAEDGSSQEIGAMVDRLRISAPASVQHVRQYHAGFRAGMIRNKAIARSSSDYIILLDGDMVMHPEFVADHAAAARAGHYSQGVRILLDESATHRLIMTDADLPGAFGPGLGFLRRSYVVRAPALQRLLRRAANTVIAIKSCNQGFWRRDLIAVNGFDETMTGWGSEDKELCARLDNAGLRRQSLIFSAIAFHLAHPPASRETAGHNEARWRQTRRSGRRRCEQGIAAHLPN